MYYVNSNKKLIIITIKPASIANFGKFTEFVRARQLYGVHDMSNIKLFLPQE